MPIDPNARLLRLTTPLADSLLLPVGVRGEERLGGLPEYRFDLCAERDRAAEVDPDALLGRPMAMGVSVDGRYGAGPRRVIHGLVREFSVLGRGEEFVGYRATVVPWLWLLTQRSDCRVFQDKTVPEVVAEVFGELAGDFPDLVRFADETAETYVRLDYCVQYRETAFAFVSRLLEREGIYYYVRHAEDGHAVVLTDGPQAHPPGPHHPTARFRLRGELETREEPAVRRWGRGKRLLSGRQVRRDYHFQMPDKDLQTTEATPGAAGGSEKLEVFDYPAGHAERFKKPRERLGEVDAEGRRVARLAAERVEARLAPRTGAGTCRGFAAGDRFALAGHFDDDGEYLLTAVRQEAVQHPPYTTVDPDDFAGPDRTAYRLLFGTDRLGPDPGGEGAADANRELDAADCYANEFECLAAAVPFRPALDTPPARVAGVQTAVVVGPPGEEIWPDEFGRVKVKFHWDRRAPGDDTGSCWVRVAQAHAGPKYGGIDLPRVGQEVVVDFLEGDPDRPLIVGRLYNAKSPVPFDLPDEKTRSGMKSQTHKGAGYNEISMDDTAGKEEIRVHGQYDMNSTIGNDLTEDVAMNRTRTVGVDESTKVGNNQSLAVAVDRDQSVGSNETLTVGANQSLMVGTNQDERVGTAKSTLVGNVKSAVVGQITSAASGFLSAEIAGLIRKITAGDSVSVKGGRSVAVDGGKFVSVNGGKGVKISAGNMIEIGCGASRITLEAGGKVTIEGTEFLFAASGPAIMHGSPIDLNP